MEVGLSIEEALFRSKRIVDFDQVAGGLRLIWPPSLLGILLIFVH